MINVENFDFIKEQHTNEYYLVLGSIKIPYLKGATACDYSTHILDLKNLKNDSDIEYVLCYIIWNIFNHTHSVVFEYDSRFKKIEDVR